MGQTEYGHNDVSPGQFLRHLDLLEQLGYRFASASEVAAGTAPPRSVAVTFDDAVTSVHDVAAPVLLDRAIPFSVFVVSSWCDHQEAWQRERIMPWTGVRALAAAGCEIGSHSVTHRRFSTLDDQAVTAELADSRQAISDHIGREITTFAIPFGLSSDWAIRDSLIAERIGYQTVYAQSEIFRPLCTVGRTFITRHDTDRVFVAAMNGAFDFWEEPGR